MITPMALAPVRFVGRRAALALVVAGLLAACISAAARAADEDAAAVTLKVVTFNVLVDFAPQPGVPPWSQRKELCSQVLRESQADLIGLQESSPGQIKFFAEELPGYAAHYYVSESGSPYPDAALMYREEAFERLDEGHWWLSPTPERVSTGFGNVLPRLVVWVRLKHRPSGRELYFFNTHFDNSRPSQDRMAELCQRLFEPFVAEGLPLIFVGDFNTDQERGDYPRLTSGGWADAYRASPLASPNGRDDNVPTFPNGKRIDHIFYHGPGLKAIRWERLESPDPDRPLSDHYPVYAELEWR